MKEGKSMEKAAERKHPEHTCQKCGGGNPAWTADNDLFNKVNGSPNGIMCPTCFASMAQGKGIEIKFIFYQFKDERREEGGKVIEYITDTLNECREYMDDKADVSVDNDYFVPKKEAKLLERIDATMPKLKSLSPESGEQDELKKENERLWVIQQEVYVKTDNPWQSDLDATAYDGKQYHFDKHTGYFHTKEQLVELLRGAYRAGRNFEYAEHYGGVPNQYPIETTYVDQIINP